MLSNASSSKAGVSRDGDYSIPRRLRILPNLLGPKKEEKHSIAHVKTNVICILEYDF